MRSATHEIGTGTYTAMSQFAADTLNIPIEKIRFELGDSQFPIAPNNGGSWLTASVAPAVIGACGQLKKQVVDLAGSWPGDARALADLFARAGQEQVQADFMSEPNSEERKKFSFFSYGAVFVDVHVDPVVLRGRAGRAEAGGFAVAPARRRQGAFTERAPAERAVETVAHQRVRFDGWHRCADASSLVAACVEPAVVRSRSHCRSSPDRRRPRFGRLDCHAARKS